MLACTSALVRKSTIEYPPGFKEGANIFNVCLAPSGARKTPTYDIACVESCEAIEDENEGVPLTLENVTVDECFRFFQDVIGNKKNALSINVMCKNDDGSS